MTQAGGGVLDRLASELTGTVRKAAMDRADATLIAQFDGMRSDVEAATPLIEQAMVIVDAPTIELGAEQRQQIAERATWVRSQLDKVLAALGKDPASVKRGGLWRETKQAIETLSTDLDALRSQAYEVLLAPFAERDRELLESLPPGTPGIADYRAAIQTFERRRELQPCTLKDVANAEVAGRRLQELRERVEAEAVPGEFQALWRALRGGGLPLVSMTPEFRAWLDERGLAESVALEYRSS